MVIKPYLVFSRVGPVKSVELRTRCEALHHQTRLALRAYGLAAEMAMASLYRKREASPIITVAPGIFYGVPQAGAPEPAFR